MVIESIHIFSFGELKVDFEKDEESFSFNLETLYLSSLKDLIDHIYYLKPKYEDINEQYHRVSIINDIVQFVPKNSKGFTLNIHNLDQNIYNRFIDELFSNIYF